MKFHIFKICAVAIFWILSSNASAQEEHKQMVRLANLVIDAAHLASYNEFLKEEIETSLRVEPGVLTLYAVAEKDNPTHITILEIYASKEAYQSHIQTPHFLKYKNGTQHMVKSLTLTETNPLIPNMKVKSKIE
jgi:quinol monooxygenase YgiN